MLFRPGGDIVVSGLSANARSVFRVVTSISPPFVMESNLDEDGLCLRGLPCHRISTSGINYGNYILLCSMLYDVERVNIAEFELYFFILFFFSPDTQPNTT